MPAPIQTLPKAGWEPARSNALRALSCFTPSGQLTPVIVQPQRGQSAPVPDRQVVPQLEQVLAVAPFAAQPQVRPGDAQPQATVPPEAVVVVQLPFPSSQSCSKAQEDWGKSGSEKNSSQTFSANSSQGGASQKPYVGTRMSTSASTFRTTVTQMVISKVQLPM